MVRCRKKKTCSRGSMFQGPRGLKNPGSKLSVSAIKGGSTGPERGTTLFRLFVHVRGLHDVPDRIGHVLVAFLGEMNRIESHTLLLQNTEQNSLGNQRYSELSSQSTL